jgi:hypothetical protein
MVSQSLLFFERGEARKGLDTIKSRSGGTNYSRDTRKSRNNKIWISELNDAILPVAIHSTPYILICEDNVNTYRSSDSTID